MCEKGYIWNSSTCNCKNCKYVGSIIGDLVLCDEIIDATKPVPRKSTSAKAILTKCISTKIVLTKCTSKIFGFNFNNFYLFVNYPSIIDTCTYLLLLHKISSKIKSFTSLSLHNEPIKRNWELKIYYKMENNDKLKKVNIKSRTCYYFDDITNFEDFDLDNILIDE